jgi:hypothetical protein
MFVFALEIVKGNELEHEGIRRDAILRESLAKNKIWLSRRG